MDVCKMAYIRGVEEGPEKETLVSVHVQKTNDVRVRCDFTSPIFCCTQGVLYDLCLEHVNTNSSGIETKDQETLDELLKACKGWEDDNRSGDAKTIFEHVVLAKVSPSPPVPQVQSSPVHSSKTSFPLTVPGDSSEPTADPDLGPAPTGRRTCDQRPVVHLCKES